MSDPFMGEATSHVHNAEGEHSGNYAEFQPPAIITRRFNKVEIGQRLDGYLNATAMCKAAGCEWKAYNRLSSTAAFLEELAGSVKISTDLLVQSVTTGPNAGRGTWVHPQVGFHLAQWCSAKFAVQVTGWIQDIATKGYATAPGVTIGAEPKKPAQARVSGALMRELMASPEKLRNAFPSLSETSLQAAFAKLSGMVLGEPLIPEPRIEGRYYTAGEIAEQHGIPANRVGRIANEAGIVRDDTTGEYRVGQSEHSARQVEHWRWNERGKALVDAAIDAWKAKRLSQTAAANDAQH